MRTLIRNVSYAPFSDRSNEIKHGDLFIEGDRLVEAAAGEPDVVIDGTGCLAVPGLINTHHHLYQSLTRCLPSVQNSELFEWLVVQYPIWANMSEEMVYTSALVSLSELLLSGCTTASDMFYVFPKGSDVTLDAVIRAAEDLGIRMHAGRGSMSRGKSEGGLPPDHVVQDPETILADTERVIGRYHQAGEGGMVRIDVAPCSPFSVTPELMRDSRALARKHGLLCHTHLAETLDEERYCLEKHGKRPLGLLEEYDWLGHDVYLAHGIHFNPEEIRLLGETRTGIAHCPSSNMRLGSGIAPVLELVEAGASVGLAVDGSSSNDGGNLLLEARQAMLLGRLRYGVRYSPQQALWLATRGGAQVLNRPELGSLEPGKMADIALFDMTRVEYAGASCHDPLGTLALCQPTRPKHVFVNGRHVVAEGELLTIDLERTVAEHNRLTRELLARSERVLA